MDLQPFTVTVRIHEAGGEPIDHDLPVDSPDAEHAVSAAMSNAVAFTPKVGPGSKLRPVTFSAVAVRPR